MSGMQMQLGRRTLLGAGLALGASRVIGAPFVVKSLADEPVKIGMIDPLTGVLSAVAQSEVDGAKYAVAEINGKNGILGRPVELLVENSGNDLSTGLQNVRTLIERDRVSAILGDLNSGTAFATSRLTNDRKMLHIVPGGHADPLTGMNCKWNVFRVCNSVSMGAEAVASELIKRFGDKWFFVLPDYAYGRLLQTALAKALTKRGGTYDGDSVPYNNTDFSAILAKAKTYKPNVLINNMTGPAQAVCMKQFAQAGMRKEMALGGVLFELETIRAMPSDVQFGWWTMEWWWNQPNLPAVAKFVTDYRTANKKTPSARAWFGYVAVHSVRLAAEAAQSLDSAKMATALEGLELPPEIALQPGTVRYRKGDHQLMPNIFVGEVHAAKGNPDDVFTVASLVPGAEAAGSVDDTGCKMAAG